MKKLLLVLAILTVTHVSNAQTGLTISDTLNISTGGQETGLYMEGTFRIASLLSTGKVYVDLNTWKSFEDKEAGFDSLYPLDSAGTKITNVTIMVAMDDEIKDGLTTMVDVVAFFYDKVKAKLVLEYGWTIN